MTETDSNRTQPESMIPEMALAVLGHNSGLAAYADVHKLECKLELLGDALTQTTAPMMRDVMKLAHDKAGTLEADRKAAQKPHEGEIEAIRAAYRPLVERSLAVKEAARRALDRFLAAEELCIQQEARDAQALLDAQREAAEQAARDATPFTQNESDDAQKALAEAEVDAEHAQTRLAAGPSVGSASGIARAGSYRTTYYVEVTDAKKMVMAFSKFQAVIEAAEKLANASARTSKGAQPIPGCVIKERRTAV
jgi:hypothetical protein